MDGSDFQMLGAASILTKKVAARKGEAEEKWDGIAVFDGAEKGDKICAEAIDEMAEVLGRGIANICFVINPEVVVLGGGIDGQEAYLRERIETALKKNLVARVAERTGWNLHGIKMTRECWEHFIIFVPDKGKESGIKYEKEK